MATSKPGRFKYAAVATISLACAWQAYTFALVPNLRLVSPDLALQYWPDDAIAIAKRVDAEIEKAGKYVSTEQDRRAAVSALIKTPLNRSSLRIIGMDAAMKGDKAAAADVLALSNRVSRRDPWTEVWLLEEAARKDDFRAFVAHYHAALAVNPEFAPALNPLLVEVTAFPQIRVALQPYLRHGARWAPGYLAAAAKDSELDDVLDLVNPVAHHLGGEAYETSVSRILLRLSAAGRSDEAMRLAEVVWPDFQPTAFAEDLPSASSTDPRLGSLAWTFGEGTGVASRLLARNGGFETTLAPLARGVVAARDVPVDGGAKYTFVQRFDFTGDWQDARIRWYAQCIAVNTDATARFWEQIVPVGTRPATYRATIKVPTGCELMKLTLAGDGPEGQSAAGLRISDLSLSKAN